MKVQKTIKTNWIPKGYVVDLEFGCQTNSEELARMNPKLRHTVGFVITRGDKGRRNKWGDNSHAWCVAPDGTIVDPYFQARFPKEYHLIEYREDSSAFDEGEF